MNERGVLMCRKFRKGFTLIEMVVVLVLIAVVARLSVPRIEEWVARQQARSAITNLLADYQKAATLARLSTNTLGTSGAHINRTALYIKTDGFLILTRGLSDSWFGWNPSTDTVLKKFDLPPRVTIAKISNNQGVLSDINNPISIAFTSTGQALVPGSGALAPTNVPMFNCRKATGETIVYAARGTMFQLRVAVNATNVINYELHIDDLGQHRLCQAINSENFGGNGVEVLSI